jgi:hypothetical protein
MSPRVARRLRKQAPASNGILIFTCEQLNTETAAILEDKSSEGAGRPEDGATARVNGKRVSDKDRPATDNKDLVAVAAQESMLHEKAAVSRDESHAGSEHNGVILPFSVHHAQRSREDTSMDGEKVSFLEGTHQVGGLCENTESSVAREVPGAEEASTACVQQDSHDDEFNSEDNLRLANGDGQNVKGCVQEDAHVSQEDQAHEQQEDQAHEQQEDQAHEHQEDQAHEQQEDQAHEQQEDEDHEQQEDEDREQQEDKMHGVDTAGDWTSPPRSAPYLYVCSPRGKAPITTKSSQNLLGGCVVQGTCPRSAGSPCDRPFVAPLSEKKRKKEGVWTIADQLRTLSVTALASKTAGDALIHIIQSTTDTCVCVYIYTYIYCLDRICTRIEAI